MRSVNESVTADNNRLRARLSELERENAEMHQEKSQLHSSMNQASAYIQELENKCFEANRASLELLGGLRDKEAEVETLK